MKKVFFIGAFLVALASAAPAKAQTSNPAVAVVQVRYETGKGGTVDFVISRGTQAAEQLKVTGYYKDDSIETNALQQVLAKLYAEGYRLVTSNGGSYRPTTYVLAKSQ